MTLTHNSPYRHRLRDEQLEELIADTIGTHPMLWGAMITIEAHYGIVTLTGVVRTPLNRTLADLLARRQGALGVDNRLRVASEGAGYDTAQDVDIE